MIKDKYTSLGHKQGLDNLNKIFELGYKYNQSMNTQTPDYEKRAKIAFEMWGLIARLKRYISDTQDEIMFNEFNLLHDGFMDYK